MVCPRKYTDEERRIRRIEHNRRYWQKFAPRINERRRQAKKVPQPLPGTLPPDDVPDQIPLGLVPSGQSLQMET